MICLHKIFKCPHGFWSQKPVSFQTLPGMFSTDCALKESVAHTVCQPLCSLYTCSPLRSFLQYLGDSHINNVHPAFLLVFFCFGESLQLNRVCLGIGAMQVLLRVSVHQHCTLSHWHLSTSYFKMSPGMANEFINSREPCKNLYNAASLCGPSPNGRT